MPKSRSERFAEFLARLGSAPAASSADEAIRQLADILNAVEDESSGVPFDPDQWQTDGRMYPPQPDSARKVPGRPDAIRYRSKGHNTLIGGNGSIEIRKLDGSILLAKPGADGRDFEGATR